MKSDGGRTRAYIALSLGSVATTPQATTVCPFGRIRNGAENSLEKPRSLNAFAFQTQECDHPTSSTLSSEQSADCPRLQLASFLRYAP
jgi:hypothetical protein